MKFNTPLPQPLQKECSKAAQICTSCELVARGDPDLRRLPVKSFVDSGNNGLDGVRLLAPSLPSRTHLAPLGRR